MHAMLNFLCFVTVSVTALTEPIRKQVLIKPSNSRRSSCVSVYVWHIMLNLQTYYWLPIQSMRRTLTQQLWFVYILTLICILSALKASLKVIKLFLSGSTLPRQLYPICFVCFCLPFCVLWCFLSLWCQRCWISVTIFKRRSWLNVQLLSNLAVIFVLYHFRLYQTYCGTTVWPVTTRSNTCVFWMWNNTETNCVATSPV